MDFNHVPVLYEACIEGLNIKPDGIYVDGTVGGGGHAFGIGSRLNEKGTIIGIDRDDDALEASKQRLRPLKCRTELVKRTYAEIKDVLGELNISGIDGALLDIGVSSFQLDNAKRGFSYMHDAPLDMRMNQNQELSAKEVVNNYSLEDLTRIFYEYGEEKYSKSIATGIVKYRENKPIETTLELVSIIQDNVPEKYRREHHPARKVFQAIRIEVNDELNVFTKALTDSIDLLNVGGRICVITFHSLEDRICKKIFKQYSEVDKVYKGLPFIPDEYKPKIKIINKIKPSKEELEDNNRSRSSILRVIEKL